MSGDRCGQYIPAGIYSSSLDLCSLEIASLQCQDFLRRAWNIDVAVPDDKWYYDKMQTRQVRDHVMNAAVNVVIYSFCLNLSSENACRLFFYRLPGDQSTVEEIRTAYYPLRLLRTEWTSVDGLGDAEEVQLHDNTAFHQAVALRKGTFAPKTALICQIAGCIKKSLTSSPHAEWKDRIFGGVLWTATIQLGDIIVGLYSDQTVAEISMDHAFGLSVNSLGLFFVTDWMRRRLTHRRANNSLRDKTRGGHLACTQSEIRKERCDCRKLGLAE